MRKKEKIVGDNVLLKRVFGFTRKFDCGSNSKELNDRKSTGDNKS